MAKRKENCQHWRKVKTVRFAYAGRWYQKWYCRDCGKQGDDFIRDVNVKDDRDCAAADASQGIV